ncbi:MAG: phosphoribosylanthranilate isomerase [Lachnospiraceae bacterium]|nr:phosphoribosylanthranilate isomerase [Lachnospiraceae bacterium]
MAKIKLCGLSRKEDIIVANKLNPEYIGFVFAPKSKRYVTFEQAAELKKDLKTTIKAVGVFVDEDIDNIVKLLKEEVIDAVQLHGHEDEEYISELRTRVKEHREELIIKAFRIDTEEDIEKAVSSSADMILLDAKDGGTGTQFDHSLLKKVKRKYFLAGGLSPDNVKNVLGETSAYAVDVSSGIETNGVKDKNKMTAFVKAVRTFGKEVKR